MKRLDKLNVIERLAKRVDAMPDEAPGRWSACLTCDDTGFRTWFDKDGCFMSNFCDSCGKGGMLREAHYRPKLEG